MGLVNVERLDAVVSRKNHSWFVSITPTNREPVIVELSDNDAWNFDVENGAVLIADYAPETNTINIVKRKRGNKKFVKI